LSLSLSLIVSSEEIKIGDSSAGSPSSIKEAIEMARFAYVLTKIPLRLRNRRREALRDAGVRQLFPNIRAGFLYYAFWEEDHGLFCPRNQSKNSLGSPAGHRHWGIPTSYEMLPIGFIGEIISLSFPHLTTGGGS